MPARRPLPLRRRARAALLPVLLASAALLPVLLAPKAAAEDAPPLRLELNRLEPREGGACRVWLVVGNPTAESIDALRLDLVLFGRDAVILRRLAVEAGPLPARRTAVRIFDIAGQGCDGIGQVLLNDVLACGGAEADRRAACSARPALSSRAAGVDFHQ